jgi:hypothetical protein
VTYAGLSAGAHPFTVRASDGLNAADLSRRFSVSATPAAAPASPAAPHCTAKLHQLTRRGAPITVTCSARARVSVTLKAGSTRVAQTMVAVGARPVRTTLRLNAKQRKALARKRPTLVVA